MVKRTVSMLSLMAVIAVVSACGSQYRSGSVPVELRIQFRDIPYHQSPITIPHPSGDTLTLRTELLSPPAERYRLDRATWKWFVDGTLELESRSGTFRAPLTTGERELRLELLTYWTVDNRSGTEKIKDTLRRTFYLAPSYPKEPDQRSINDFNVGTFPTIGDRFAWVDGAMVVHKEEVGFYGSSRTERRADDIPHGSRVEPTADPPTIKNKRLQVRWNDREGWIPLRAVQLPPSVRYHPDRYREPRNYFPITKRNQSGYVLPFIRWKEFNHDSYYRQSLAPAHPHYIPFSTALLEKLHGLQDLLKKEGHSQRIVLISGCRNPSYNLGEFSQRQSLKALFSRHQYGDAVDLIVDGSMDGVMDDLNRDGRVTLDDVRVVYRLMARWEERHDRYGGLGLYAYHDVTDRKQTPYLHIDTRGFRARWSVQ